MRLMSIITLDKKIGNNYFSYFSYWTMINLLRLIEFLLDDY